MQSAVAETRKLFERVDSGVVTEAPGRATKLSTQIAAMEKHQAELAGSRYAIEVASSEILKTKIREVIKKRDASVHLARYGHLPRLGLEPLTWRDKQGWPRLACLPLDQYVMQFFAKWSRASLEPDLPKAITDQYADVQKILLGQAFRRNVNVTLSARFAGIIPPETKQRIEENRGLFGCEIYLLIEVDGWALSERALPREADSIVVGYVPKAQEFRVIDVFDPTPLEALILEEHTAEATGRRS